jgi:hypothetical protein
VRDNLYDAVIDQEVRETKEVGVLDRVARRPEYNGNSSFNPRSSSVGSIKTAGR